MLVIFVVESDSKSQTDKNYINTLVRTYYEKGNRYEFIFMGGKTNFSKVEKNINLVIKKYNSSNYVVIFCIDIDNFKDASKNSTNIELNKKIIKYVADKNYNLVYFYKDIEDVFIREELDKKDKVKRSLSFIAKKEINNIDLLKLHYNKITNVRHSSNLMYVLDKYIARK